MMNFLELLFYVTVYSFLGWCVEVIYHTAKYGDFSNRGFVNGPVCTIYGVGFTGAVCLLNSFRDNVFVLFGVSILLATALEFLTGWVLEKVFHEKWWDYSKEPFNVKGYICLRFSLIWGLACTSAMVAVHPLIEKLYHSVPQKAMAIGLGVCFAIYLADWGVTVVEIRKLQIRLGIVKSISDCMDDIANFLGSNLHESTLDVMKKGEEGKEFLQETHDAYVEKREALQLSMAENREIFLGRLSYETERLKKNFDENREDFTKSVAERRDKLLQTLSNLRNRYENTSFKPSHTKRRLERSFPALHFDREDKKG